ncbi:unnamed protein product (macronuclear) [Paramecium tetraurelia]|uniref:Ribosome biogenesis protein NOP53 n=1 Tax=Paramecium tetraurelia TaxID=5888 RepID=A0BI08_PARTE|nr:uncharacterized protein GSPATT00029211001 [Paramecium tetraurelia]CAK58175.1 unnamed protein product [Paramecium tetraurelia]|eukprot:XP_001425573.1 hypothetical protein (macronuclear) [Paramecium tetraurelia strain d4-2]
MNSLLEQPFQYRQLRSQSLSPYNDCNLIKQLKRQLHYPPQKMMQLASYEYMQNPEQDETNVISSGKLGFQQNIDSIQHYQRMIKERKNSLIVDSDLNTLKQEAAQSADINQLKQIVPKLVVVKKLNQKLYRKKKKKINPVNPQDCNDDDILHQTIVVQPNNSITQAQQKKEDMSILPQIKKQKLQIEEQPIKRSARYEQLMKKSIDDQFVELQSLIKKMQKSPINRKDKKVTFLL